MYIFKNNMKRIFRSKARLMIMFIVPIFFALLFMSKPNYTAVKLLVVDKDQTQLTQILIDQLSAQNKVELVDESILKDQLISGIADYALVIPENFTQSILADQLPLIEEHFFIGQLKLQGTRAYIDNYVKGLLQIALATDNESDFYQQINQLGAADLTVDFQVVEDVANLDFSSSGIGFAAQFVLYMSIITAGLLLIDREKNTLVRILASPVTKSRYIIENLLSFAVISGVQIIAIFLFYRYGMGLYYGKNFYPVMLLMFVFSLTAVTLSMVIVALCKNEKMAYGTMLVISSPLMMLGGGYFPVDTLSSGLQKVSKLLPTYWMMNGAEKLWTGESGILSNALVLLTFALTFFIISIISNKKYAKG